MAGRGSKALEQHGVEVLTGEIVASVEPARVTPKPGQVLSGHTVRTDKRAKG